VPQYFAPNDSKSAFELSRRHPFLRRISQTDSNQEKLLRTKVDDSEGTPKKKFVFISLNVRRLTCTSFWKCSRIFLPWAYRPSAKWECAQKKTKKNLGTKKKLIVRHVRLSYLRLGYLKLGYLRLDYLRLGYLRLGYLRLGRVLTSSRGLGHRQPSYTRAPFPLEMLPYWIRFSPHLARAQYRGKRSPNHTAFSRKRMSPASQQLGLVRRRWSKGSARSEVGPGTGPQWVPARP